MSIPYSTSTASFASAIAHSHSHSTSAPLLSLRIISSLHRARMNTNYNDYHTHLDDLSTSQWLAQDSNDEEDVFLHLVPSQINHPIATAGPSSTMHHQSQPQQQQQQPFVQNPHRQFSSGAQSFQSFEDFNSPASSYYSASTADRSPFNQPDQSTSIPFTFQFPSYENTSLYPSSNLIPSASTTVAPTPTHCYNTSPSHQQWSMVDSPYQALFASYEAIRDPQSGMHSASSSTSSYNTPPNAVTTTSLPASISMSPDSSASSTGSIRKLEALLPELEMTDSKGHSVKRPRSKSDDVREGIPACDFCRKRKVKCDRKRPTCSFCARHGQQCRTEDRLRKRGPPTKVQREEMRRLGLVYDRHKRQWLPTKVEGQ